MSRRLMAIAAYRARCWPTPPPTAMATATTRVTRLSAATTRCLPPAQQCQGLTHHHPPCLGRCEGAHRRQPADRMGQGYLPPPQGDRRALLRRRQATAWSPLCAVPKSHQGRLPVPDRRRRPEHQKDRPLPVPETQAGPRMRLNASCQNLLTQTVQDTSIT